MEPTIKPLPRAITSYDLLKLLAVVTMIIDHLGAFIFPDNLELRAIGRMSMPIWLFLVGYANTRDIPPILWGGAMVLLFSYLVAGNQLLSLNILFTIIITRFVIDGVMRISLKNNEYLVFMLIGLAFLAIPTALLFDYGTLAIMWAMVGYIMRHREAIEWSDSKVFLLTVIVTLIYVGYQSLFFGFNASQNLIMAISVGVSAVALNRFVPKTLDSLSIQMPKFARDLIQFCGRKTLYIYVVHLILFLAIAFFIFPEEYGFFHLNPY